ncbi:hypothetical protein [Pseudokineococcus lusitanus]|uniref:hypothetical protein n=1 Tax=Pseudokineococcus lusitanus TaxID=763993 RepID=UPI0011CD51F5|nr:hypothetical protein [Pseudokineococcus lusitanus]
MSEAPGRPGPAAARPPVPGPPRPGPQAPQPVTDRAVPGPPPGDGPPAEDAEVRAAADVLAALPADAPSEDVAAALEDVRARLARRLQGTAR